MTLRELSLAIADHGRWEEFHQRRHEYECFDWHKARRLELEQRYHALRAGGTANIKKSSGC